MNDQTAAIARLMAQRYILMKRLQEMANATADAAPTLRPSSVTTPSPTVSWLAVAGCGVTIQGGGNQTIDDLAGILYRLHSELGGDRLVKFSVEVL